MVEPKNEEKTEFSEKAVWHDKDNCTIEWKKKFPMYNPNRTKVVGYNENKGKSKTTRKELQLNLNSHYKMRDKHEERKNQIQKQIDDRRGIQKQENLLRTKTKEMIRIEKTFRSLQLINEIRNFEVQILPINEQIKEVNTFIDMRMKTLSDAPIK